MRKACELMIFALLLAVPLFAQEMRLWVLREPGEMVEYDLTTFAVKNRVKVPPQALKFLLRVQPSSALPIRLKRCGNFPALEMPQAATVSMFKSEELFL